MKYVVIASFCIGLSGTWFSFTNVDLSGFILFAFFAGLSLVIGVIIAYIGKLRFTPQLRVACAYISCVTILAMPIQLFFTTIMFGF